MSGGHFEYNQYQLIDIINSIQELIDTNGLEKTDKQKRDTLLYDLEYYKKFPEELYNIKYNDEIIKNFKNAIKCISNAKIYINEIDYLVSSDINEDTFVLRLNENLK
jgi:hypothetical protein